MSQSLRARHAGSFARAVTHWWQCSRRLCATLSFLEKILRTSEELQVTEEGAHGGEAALPLSPVSGGGEPGPPADLTMTVPHNFIHCLPKGSMKMPMKSEESIVVARALLFRGAYRHVLLFGTDPF